LLFSFAAFPFLYGQEEFEENPKRLFSVMAYGDDFFEGIKFVDAEERRVDLEFRPDRRSKVYAYDPEDSKIIFFREVVDEKGVVRDVPVAEADVEDIGERALIVFFESRAEDSPYPYALRVADESEAAFSGGGFRFLNVCNVPLFWRIGSESGEFGTGFSPVVSYEADDRGARSIALAIRVGEEWKIVFSTRSQSHPDLGTLFVVKPPLEKNSLHVRVHALRDRLLPYRR